MCVGFNFAPQSWAMCNGTLMPINTNQALFAQLGTVYGGNGMTTFGLPNLQGRTPISVGTGFPLGQVAGEETHRLLQGEVPAHTHPLSAFTTLASAKKPNGEVFAGTSGALTVYRNAGNLGTMAAQSITQMGASQPHENRQPYLVLNWIIALAGIFPTQS
jgi:microcystin-dependent protein